MCHHEKERNDSSRQFSSDFTSLDVYGPLCAGVPRVKMRRLMIAVVDGHNDAKESANDWHSCILNVMAPCAYSRDWLLELTAYRSAHYNCATTHRECSIPQSTERMTPAVPSR
jgi:hypothetical protein